MFWKKTLPPDVFGDVLEKVKHLTNDASNDVSRLALWPPHDYHDRHDHYDHHDHEDNDDRGDHNDHEEVGGCT